MTRITEAIYGRRRPDLPERFRPWQAVSESFNHRHQSLGEAQAVAFIADLPRASPTFRTRRASLWWCAASDTRSNAKQGSMAAPLLLLVKKSTIDPFEYVRLASTKNNGITYPVDWSKCDGTRNDAPSDAQKDLRPRPPPRRDLGHSPRAIFTYACTVSR